MGDTLITEWKMLSLDFAVEDPCRYCRSFGTLKYFSSQKMGFIRLTEHLQTFKINERLNKFSFVFRSIELTN